MHKTDRSLVTQTYRIIETGSDDPSVPLNSSYSSFRSSLNLNVDFCSKNVSTLRQREHMKGETSGRAGWEKTGVTNILICNRRTTLLCGATYWHKMIQDPQSLHPKYLGCGQIVF